MKVKNKLLARALALSLTLVGYSCTDIVKDTPDASNAIQLNDTRDSRVKAETPNSIVRKSQDLQFLYVRENLKVIAEGILKASVDESFKDHLYAEINKKFDGDDNALINTLLNPSINSNASVVAMASQLRAISLLNATLNAFKGIEGQDLNPQIYIPFYENHKASSSNRARTNGESPMVVLWDGNEDQNVYPGYRMKGNQLSLSGIDVDEKYAEENEVWVFSLSETSSTASISISSGRKGANLRSNAFIDAYVEKMTIRDAKESWAGGKSEIHINAYTTFWNGTDPQTGQTNRIWNVPEANMVCLAKVPFKPDIRDKIERTYNCQINNSWDVYGTETSGRGDWFPYVIYEHDGWPASMDGNTVSVGTLDIEIQFRSSNSSYVHDKFNYSNTSTYSVDIAGQIKMNTKEN